MNTTTTQPKARRSTDGLTEVPPGYRQTEVGVLPEDWEVLCLSEFGKFRSGSGFPLRYQGHDSGDYPFFKVSDMNNDGNELFMRTAKNLIKKDMQKLIGASIFPRDCIVFAKIGAAIFLERKKLLAQESCIDNNMMAFWLRNSQDSPRFGHLLFLRIELGRFVSTTALPSLSGRVLGEIRVPVPKPAEQHAIAEALSDLDELIEALGKMVAKKRAIKQATMQQLLSGKTRLPGFIEEWDKRPLRNFVREFIVPMRDKPKRLTGNIPWCRIEDFDGIYLTGSKSGQHVDAQTVQDMNLKVYPVGTLLVSCSADLGRCAIVARPLVSNQTFIGLVVDGAVSSNLFFYYYMTAQSEELNNRSSGTTISYLSRKQFEDFSVLVPLDKEEQATIAGILSDIDAEIAALERRRDKTKQIKQGMMQQLLTGRVRLVPSETKGGENA